VKGGQRPAYLWIPNRRKPARGSVGSRFHPGPHDTCDYDVREPCHYRRSPDALGLYLRSHRFQKRWQRRIVGAPATHEQNLRHQLEQRVHRRLLERDRTADEEGSRAAAPSAQSVSCLADLLAVCRLEPLGRPFWVIDQGMACAVR
jgi:hypothetical protein